VSEMDEGSSQSRRGRGDGRERWSTWRRNTMICPTGETFLFAKPSQNLEICTLTSLHVCLTLKKRCVSRKDIVGKLALMLANYFGRFPPEFATTGVKLKLQLKVPSPSSAVRASGSPRSTLRKAKKPSSVHQPELSTTTSGVTRTRGKHTVVVLVRDVLVAPVKMACFENVGSLDPLSSPKKMSKKPKLKSDM